MTGRQAGAVRPRPVTYVVGVTGDRLHLDVDVEVGQAGHLLAHDIGIEHPLARQRDVLQSIAVDSASIKDTAAKFSMSEGAVRVALHRGLSSLTAKLRER